MTAVSISNEMSLLTDEKLKQAEAILSGPDDSRRVPDWFAEQQRTAWTEFERLPMPNRNDQPWRFSTVKLLDLNAFTRSQPVPDAVRNEILERSQALSEVSARLVFAGDELIHRDVVSEQLRQRGVIFQPLERAMVEHEELFRKYFMAHPAKLGSAKFAALHKALVSSGTFLYVPRGVELQLPIEIFHWLHGENASVFPHLLLVADELAKVTVLECFRSTDPGANGFACGVNDLITGPGAKVAYICAQDWGTNV